MIIPKNLKTEDIAKYLKENHKRINLIGKYKNGSTKMKLKCKIDDFEWNVYAREIYDETNIQCRECNRRAANLQLKNRFILEYPGFRIVTMDIFSNSKTHIQCDVCGHQFELYRKHLIGNNIQDFSEEVDTNHIIFRRTQKKDLLCPVCSINDVKGKFETIVKERNAVVVGDYVNNTSPVDIKCNDCGNVFGVVPSYYISKLTSSCKFCTTKIKRSK